MSDLIPNGVPLWLKPFQGLKRVNILNHDRTFDRSTLAETLLGIETEFPFLAIHCWRRSTLAETLLGIETSYIA